MLGIDLLKKKSYLNGHVHALIFVNIYGAEKHYFEYLCLPGAYVILPVDFLCISFQMPPFFSIINSYQSCLLRI